MMGSKIVKTIVLIGIFVGVLVADHVIKTGEFGLVLVPALSSDLRFKVEYGYFMIPALDCPGGRCQRPEAKRLKVQSLNEEPISIKDLIVNDRTECILVNGPKDSTMKFGDVSYVLSLCEPVRVRILTDRGEKTYEME
jgi:hypothetical protein